MSAGVGQFVSEIAINHLLQMTILSFFKTRRKDNVENSCKELKEL